MVVAMANQTGRVPGHLRRTAAHCAVALAAVGVLAACGGGGSADKTDKGVDTLVSAPPGGSKATPSAGASEAAVNAKRPQLRLDTTPEEAARLGDAYNACLQAHGVPMYTKRAELAGVKQASPVQGPEISKKYRTSFEACLVKLPLQPPETEPGTNPHFADDYRDYVTCLNKKGMKVHMVPDTSVSPDGLGWNFDEDSPNISSADETTIERDCTKAAFGGKG